MWWTDRRDFLRSLGAVVPMAMVPRALWPWLRVDLPAERLRPVAEAVLPSRLGPEGVAKVVDGFRDWLDGYRPGAERSHGYGSGSMEIRHLPPDPTPRWQADLDELDGLARGRSVADFAALPLEERKGILRVLLADDAASALDSPVDADHVAVALMAFWFGSAEAADEAYGASIAKETCRPLASVGDKPAPGGIGRLP